MKRRYVLIFVMIAGLLIALLAFRRVTDNRHGAPAVASIATTPRRPAITAVQRPADASSSQSAIFPTARKVETAERAPDPVMEAVNRQKPHDQRMAAVERISDLSAPGAQKAMIDYLSRPLSGMDGDRGAEYELRNNMLNKLREHPAEPRAVTEALLKIYRDPGQEDVLRGYAIQHIAGWIRTGALAPGDREQLLAAVRDAATKVDNPAMGGAALIALREVGPAEDAGAFAMRALNAGSACPESRISAFQVCAELGVDKALEPARTALADRNAPAVLRMSAVNVLAKLGGPADERLLQELSTGGSVKISGQSAEQNIKAGRPANDELVRNAARLALAARKSEGR